MADFKITCYARDLNAHTVDSGNDKTCVLFLSGGGTKLGKERYYEWQEKLNCLRVSSVSFDYSGVNGSGNLLEENSLESRIEEARCVTELMKNNIHAKEYILYGVSMGGYIALGLMAKMPNVFSKLILHAPAAYSSRATALNFGERFTEEIRRENSWEDSLSFDWLKRCTEPVLLIEAEKDEVIPTQIISRYKAIKQKDKNFKILALDEATHNIWKNTPENAQFRNEIFGVLISFIGSLKRKK